MPPDNVTLCIAVLNGHPLHIMVKPRPHIRTAICALEWMDTDRPPDALHWTVIPDQETEAWTLAAIVPVLENVDAAPFTLVFDQARGRGGGTAEIYCRHVPAEARRLVAALRKAFARIGIAFTRGVRPHATLSYRWSGADFDLSIPPIAWEVDGIQLVESVTGARVHRSHGEFLLVPRQGTLFPLTPCDARQGAGAGLAGLPFAG